MKTICSFLETENPTIPSEFYLPNPGKDIDLRYLAQTYPEDCRIEKAGNGAEIFLCVSDRAFKKILRKQF